MAIPAAINFVKEYVANKVWPKLQGVMNQGLFPGSPDEPRDSQGNKLVPNPYDPQGGLINEHLIDNYIWNEKQKEMLRNSGDAAQPLTEQQQFDQRTFN